MYNKSFTRNEKLLYFKTYKNHFFFKWTNSIWTSLLQKQKTTSFYNTLNQSMKIGFIISSNISDNTILVLFHQDKSLTRKQKKNNYFILDFKTYKNPFFCIYHNLLHISDNTILVLFHQDKSFTRKQKNNYSILDFKTYKNPFFCILANREIDISGQVS